MDADPRCDDERAIRALHEAAHAVVALLIGVDFEDVTLPAPDDVRTGLRFEQIHPDGDADRAVWLQVERQISMRFAGGAVEELLCGAIRYAGTDEVDAMADAASLTVDPNDQFEVRRLARARSRTLVRLALPVIEGAAARLAVTGRLDWAEVAEIVLNQDSDE